MVKIFILMLFNRERELIEYLSNFMANEGQIEVAQMLIKFNKSEKFMGYKKKPRVTPATVIRGEDSKRFRMNGCLRGYCLVIVNEEKLKPLGEQIRGVFTQMFFCVELIDHGQTVDQLKRNFSSLLGNEKFKTADCLVTFLIGHGANGEFEGKDYLDVSIPELIDLCYDNSSTRNYFKEKPIIHIFDCCRGV